VTREAWRDPRVWIGALSSALFVWLTLRGVEPDRLAEALGKAHYGYAAPAALLAYLIIWIRALRWRVLLLGIKTIRPASLFKATIIGFMANYLLPARVGELVRAYLIGSREDVATSSAFATVVMERLLDVFSILVVFGLVTLLIRFPHGHPELERALQAAAYLLFAAALGVVGLLWLLKRRMAWLLPFLQRSLGRHFPRAAASVGELLQSFARGVGPVKGRRHVMAIAVHTVLLWCLSASVIVLLAEGFGLDLPWEASWVMLVALAFGVSVPSAPGFVGTFHYAAVLCLQLYGVERSQALSFAIVLHAANILPVCALGMVFLWGEGLSLGRLAGVRRKEMGRGKESGGSKEAGT
jgi:uncharacterized protein (TIRG00374 family)